MGRFVTCRRSVHSCLPKSWQTALSRDFSSRASLYSGHNKWSKIKHDKGKNDAAKSKVRGALSHDIALASRLGGPNPTFNARLAAAIANAKKVDLSKTSIESAIARGQGKSTSGASLESLTIEVMLPFSVGAIIECLTDRKMKALQDIRTIISRRGGTMTPTSFLFERKGRVVFEKKEGVSSDEVLDQAIEAGATDVDTEEDGRIVVETEPTQVSAVSQQLSETLGLNVESADIVYDPKEDTLVSVKDENMAELEGLVALIEDDPSVQDVYTNIA